MSLCAFDVSIAKLFQQRQRVLARYVPDLVLGSLRVEVRISNKTDIVNPPQRC